MARGLPPLFREAIVPQCHGRPPCQGRLVRPCLPPALRMGGQAAPGTAWCLAVFNRLKQPAFLTQGNLGLQTNYGPSTRTVDFSLFKDFPFTERWRLQFRAESFNIGNTPQFSVPEVNQNNTTTFGKVTATSTGSERPVQFSLRLQF